MTRIRFRQGVTLPILAVVSVLAGGRLAHAGEPSRDCRYPYVFSDGAVNLVVLPYSYHSARRNTPASDAARQIPLLLQANGLLQMLRYGGVGSLNLVNPYDDPDCKPEVVLEALTAGEFRPGQLRPGHGLILVWGTLYEEGDDVQLQTFMRILRRDRAESLVVQLPGEESMVVRPSTTTLAFAPQSLTRADLEGISSAFRRAVEVRSDPSPTAALAPFTFYEPHGLGSAYHVARAKGEWLQVQDSRGRSGWIRADFDWGSVALPARLPEVEFIGLAAGYLRVRVAADRPGDRAPARTLAWVRASLDRYLAAAGPDADEVASAVGQQLVALTACAQASVGASGWALADSSADRAADALPNDAEAQRLAGAIALLADADRGAVARRSVQVERRFARAAVIAGGGNAGLADLMTLYRLVRLVEPTPRGESAVETRIPGKIAEERLQAIVHETSTGPK